MFNKKKGNTSEMVAENITTIIAEDCKIEGTIQCKAFIKVDGHALGGILSAGGVILGQNGFVKGDIKTRELIVFGRIEGDVFADNLILKETGSIIGNMKVKSFQVEQGAQYKGTVEMENNSSSSVSDEKVKFSPKTENAE